MNELSVLSNLTVSVSHISDSQYVEELTTFLPDNGIEVTDELLEYKVQLDIPKCSRFSAVTHNVFVVMTLYMTDAGITCKKFEVEENDLKGNKLAYTCGIKTISICINSRRRVYA